MIQVVLKDKEGKVLTEREYPEKNALKLISRNSGWVLPDKSPYELIDGQLKKKTPKGGSSETSKSEAAL